MTIDSHVCVIGAANVDLTGHSHGAIVAQESNPGRLHISWGGVGRNIAQNLAQLGQSVQLITVLGDDEFGRRLRRETAACGVRMHARMIAGGATPAYLAINDGDGELVAAVAAMDLLDQLTMESISGEEARIREARLCVIDANLNQQLIGALLDRFPEQDFCMDAVSMAKTGKLKPWLGRFGILKLNRAEAGCLTGIEIDTADTRRAAADCLLAAGVGQVFISLGNEGLFYADGHTSGSLGSQTGLEPVSASGAGDAMMAGIAHAHLRGVGIEQAAIEAMAAALITLQHRDAVNPGLNPSAVQRTLEQIQHV